MPSTIELGLGRITRLLQDTPLAWRAVHVAGTNGKGSICGYVSAGLNSAGLKVGRFTSPHFIDRWDCITIDEKPIQEGLFLDIEAKVKARNQRDQIGATNFELLTATAFEAFNQQEVDVGVVEVGLGGRLDATNVLRRPLVTILAKIGLDHQSFLGSTLEEIAYQKAGIMKKGVPCVYDGTNSPNVIVTFGKCAKEVEAGPLTGVVPSKRPEAAAMAGIPTHQQVNMLCSLEALRIILPQYNIATKDDLELIHTMQKSRLPGRLESVSIEPLTGFSDDILLDGAHNPQAAHVLAEYVDLHFRQNANRRVTWVLAATYGKDITNIYPIILKPGDAVVATEFGPVAGMPWIRPTKTQTLLDCATSTIQTGETHDCGSDVLKALQTASNIAREKSTSIVVAGSLYLVSDVLRLLRDK